jgi:hypothetical protein
MILLHQENVAMKSKRLFQTFVLLTLLFSSFGTDRPVRAVDPLEIRIVERELDGWGVNHTGYLNPSIYENWRFALNGPRHFTVTITPVVGDLVPLLVLLDAEGNELLRRTGTLTSAQPAGNYSLQVQSQTGQGYYLLMIQDVMQAQPIASIVFDPSTITLGGTAPVTVRLDNLPAEGYTSLELTCTYSPNVVEAKDIVVANLFGADPVVAIQGPQNGRFIVAIAGSDGRKATSAGPVMTFNVKGVQGGQTPIECQARVSKGDNTLTGIASSGANAIVLGSTVTPTIAPLACDKAEFIADITIPPGAVIAPNVQFTKRWRLKNVGSCVWTTSYRIAFYGGEQMGAPSSVRLPAEVAPGQMVDFWLDMIAPAAAGPQRGYWIFQNDTGKPFGVGPQANQPWFVDIIVSNATLTPTTTPTGEPETPTPEEPTNTATPSITPGGPTATPMTGVVFDFAENVCTATWYGDMGWLPCPGTDGDPRGFVLKLDAPRLETGIIDTRPGLLTFPQSIQNGFIQGVYPPFHVQSSDRFRSILNCEFGATSCYVAFRLDYQIGSEPVQTFWGPFLERYDGHSYTADVDLSRLAGRDVKFILTVLSAGRPDGDRALWASPIIYRPGAGPTPDMSHTPTPTPTAHGSDWLTFTNPRYAFVFKYPPQGHVVPGSHENLARIDLPVLTGTNLHEKYLEVSVVENANSCQSPLPSPRSSETVTLNDISFLKQTGVMIYAGRTYKWTAYSTARERACVSLGFIMHSTDPSMFTTPPPILYDEAVESAVFAQIAGTYAWLAPFPSTPLPTFAFTPIPSLTPTVISTAYDGTPQYQDGLLAGQVLSSGPVTVSLFDSNHNLFTGSLADSDGSYVFPAHAGISYTVVASSPGHLSAQGSAMIMAGRTTTMPRISLLAGDIDNNNAIDQFDAMTIGMNYNSALPSTADLNSDGTINVLDLELLARNYRKTGPIPWQ